SGAFPPREAKPGHVSARGVHTRIHEGSEDRYGSPGTGCVRLGRQMANNGSARSGSGGRAVANRGTRASASRKRTAEPNGNGSGGVADRVAEPTSLRGRSESKEQLIDFYRQMVLIRRFEEKTAEMYTRAKIGGYCHLNLGEEATIIGVSSALE